MHRWKYIIGANIEEFEHVNMKLNSDKNIFFPVQGTCKDEYDKDTNNC